MWVNVIVNFVRGYFCKKSNYRHLSVYYPQVFTIENYSHDKRKINIQLLRKRNNWLQLNDFGFTLKSVNFLDDRPKVTSWLTEDTVPVSTIEYTLDLYLSFLY